MVDIATGWVELVAVLDARCFSFHLRPWGSDGKRGVSAKLGEFLGNLGLNGANFSFSFCLMAEMSNWAVLAKTGAETRRSAEPKASGIGLFSPKGKL